MKPRITYWLVPSESSRESLQKRIKQLGASEQSVVFVPHVTVYCGESYAEKEDPEALLKAASAGISPITLECIDIRASELLTKTLFIQFEQSSELTTVCEKLRSTSATPSTYVLDPHLSLLYKDYPIERKQALADSEELAFPKIEFNELWANRSPKSITIPEHISEIEPICRIRLQ